MNDIHSDPQDEADIPEWARNLEAMRRQRETVQPEHTADNAELSDSTQAHTELPPEPEPTEEERELAYQRYLQSWQRQHNLAPEAETASSTHILFGDEWQQECSEILAHEKVDTEPTVLLKLDIEGDTVQELPTHPTAEKDAQDLFTQTEVSTPTETPPCYVKVLAPPLDTDMRVAIMDETVLIQQLQEKLRPHLNDAVAGVVKTAIQKHLHALVQELQTEIPQELESVVDEVMQLHLRQALDQVKAAAGIVKKVS